MPLSVRGTELTPGFATTLDSLSATPFALESWSAIVSVAADAPGLWNRSFCLASASSSPSSAAKAILSGLRSVTFGFCAAAGAGFCAAAGPVPSASAKTARVATFVPRNATTG